MALVSLLPHLICLARWWVWNVSAGPTHMLLSCFLFFPEGKWGTKILEHPDYLTSELLLKYTLTLLGHWMQVKIDSGRRIKRSSQTTVCEGLIYLNSNKLMSTYYVSGTGIDARETKMKEIISFFNIYFIHYAITVVSIFPFSTLHLVPLSPPSNSLPEFTSMGYAYKFVGFSISYTVLFFFFF